MRTRTKIAIDRWVGLPIAWALNLLARVLGVVLQRDHLGRPEDTRTIVVAKFFGLGSILQATPLLRALHRRFPTARLIFVSSFSNRRLLERLSDVDEVLLVDDRDLLRLAASTTRALVTLLARRTDLFLDLEVYSAYASVFSLLTMARNRIGFYRYSTAFKRGICTHLVFFNARQPIRRLYLQLGHAAGAVPPPGDGLTPPRVSESDHLSLAEKLPAAWRLGPERPYLVVNPNASDLLLERRWPADRMAALLEALVRDGHRVVLVGSRDEVGHTDFVRGLVAERERSQVIDTAGRLDLGELLALLAHAACTVTNDTGPMHMSIALQRPTVCLFGPCSPDHYGIEQPAVEIVYKPVYCSPCVHEVDRPPCGGDNVCMQLMEVEEVLHAVNRALGMTAHRGRAACAGTTMVDGLGHPLGIVVRGSVPLR